MGYTVKKWGRGLVGRLAVKVGKDFQRLGDGDLAERFEKMEKAFVRLQKRQGEIERKLIKVRKAVAEYIGG